MNAYMYDVCMEQRKKKVSSHYLLSRPTRACQCHALHHSGEHVREREREREKKKDTTSIIYH